jgi:hypothetical protein
MSSAFCDVVLQRDALAFDALRAQGAVILAAHAGLEPGNRESCFEPVGLQHVLRHEKNPLVGT